MYADALRDHVELQHQALTSNSAGGFTQAWTTVRRIPCGIESVSSREKLTYKRQGHEHVLRIRAEDPIPRTLTHTSLHALLNSGSRDRMRLMYQGGRTLTIIGYSRLGQGGDHPLGDQVEIIVVETPRKVGAVDA